jgi:hypothetical protein
LEDPKIIQIIKIVFLGETNSAAVLHFQAIPLSYCGWKKSCIQGGAGFLPSTVPPMSSSEKPQELRKLRSMAPWTLRAKATRLPATLRVKCRSAAPAASCRCWRRRLGISPAYGDVTVEPSSVYIYIYVLTYENNNNSNSNNNNKK